MKIVFVVLFSSLLVLETASADDTSAVRPLAAATIARPHDQEVCFSPAGSCDLKLVALIRSARKSIDVAIYDINLPALINELLLQANKIPVRILVDRRQSKEEHSRVPSLMQHGANVRYGRQRGIFHNKFTIVDGNMVETGSFNYTRNASSNNSENQVYLASPVIVNQYLHHFEELWQKAAPRAGRSYK